MLLDLCYPGRVVTFHRHRSTFTARIRHVTPRGNVSIRVHARDGKPVPPFKLSLPHGRLDDAATATEGVEQTEKLF